MPEPTEQDAAPKPVDVAEPAAPAAPAVHWRTPAAVALAYFAYYQIALRLPDAVGFVLLSTVVSLVLAIWFTASAARALRSTATAAFGLLALVVIVIPLRALAARQHPAALAIIAHCGGLPDLGLIWIGVAGGVLLSRIVRAVNMIPAVAGALALVDIWTVLLGGPVSQMMHSSNAAMKTVTKMATVQLAGNPTGATPIPVVGFADFLFIAFFVGAMCRLLPKPGVYERTIRSLAGILVPYMVLVIVTGWSLPALLPMAVAMIAVHWREYRYTREEAFALLYALLMVVGIIAFFTLRRK